MKIKSKKKGGVILYTNTFFLEFLLSLKKTNSYLKQKDCKKKLLKISLETEITRNMQYLVHFSSLISLELNIFVKYIYYIEI